MSTVQHLYAIDQPIVATLILLFALIVPIVKGGLLIAVTFIKSVNDRYRLYRLLDSLSKWSMADVFAMAIFVAFLTAKAVQEIKAELGLGFYFFTAHCLVSLLAVQIVFVEHPLDFRVRKGVPHPEERVSLINDETGDYDYD